MEEEDYNTQQIHEYNEEASSSALQLRLETKDLRIEIETFLKNYEYEIVGIDEEGNQKIKKNQIAKPLANDEGVKGILRIAGSVLNNHVVQGSYYEDDYREYISRVREEIASIVMENLYNWNIKESNYNLIVDTLMFTIKPFLSRTINDGERKSYIATLKTSEVNTITPKKSVFGIKY